MTIEENLSQINQVIKQQKEKYQISHPITLIAVSKQKPVEDIQEAINAGHFVFGENRVQEIIEKIPQINNPKVEWHFIGHLQQNKVKHAVELVHVIHSIDKKETAFEIEKCCQKLNKTINIFIQVNTSREKQKSGVEPDSVAQLIEEIKDLKHVQIIGLMTMGPLTENESDIRASFILLRKIKEQLNDKYPFLKLLSMGMSGDYELAIQEGATHIRVGTAIFGNRKAH